MYIIDLDSIEYSLEFIQKPEPFNFRNDHINHRLKHHRYKNRYNMKNWHFKQHKNMIHKYNQHPASYRHSWENFYNTNSSTISNIFLPVSINTLNCSRPGNCISYIPFFMLNDLGVLLFIFIFIYSICQACKPSTRQPLKIQTSQPLKTHEILKV